MGVIKDGTITGVLPNSKLFAVNYPGYPSSMERAMMTLGGAEGIAKVHQSPSNNLELRFRPEDPYSHPVFGELFPCNNFLLKISKHDTKGGPSETDAISHLKEDEIHADIVGRVSEAYYFNGMVDYQHVLAVHADVVRRKKRNWADVGPQFEKRGLIDADQEDLMILLPPLFSVKNIPENVVLKPSMDCNTKKKQEGAQQYPEMEIERSFGIDFGIKDVPKKVKWETFLQEGTNDWNYQMAVCELFDERPIWIKQSLSEHLSNKGLKIGDNTMKMLLFVAAYYFSNGPFLKFYIRRGYDPRKDSESRIYQRIDFRVPPALRTYCDKGIASGSKHKWEDLCAFRVFPYKCQTSFQLYELADDYIQQEIKKPLTQPTCTLATGWFPTNILDTLRLCVSVRFLSVYPDPGAECLLKSTSLRLEKSKRKPVIKEHIVNEEEHQQLNREHAITEEKEMSNDEDDDGVVDDDVEDDMEDENADEDFDAYEGLDMAGDGTDFLPESSYANQDNISKNYLQELFGSFPYNGGSNEFQDAENSDGEYQIYDQNSDENYSDDDY